MYKLVMENHKRLNRLEKEFLALEKRVNEKDKAVIRVRPVCGLRGASVALTAHLGLPGNEIG